LEVLADAGFGAIDRLLDAVNPIDAIVSIPDIGPQYGNTTAYAIGGAVGTVAGIGVTILVTGPAGGLVKCGSWGQKILAGFENLSAAGNVAAAQQSFQQGDNVGVALNLISAAGSIVGLRNTLSQCFVRGTPFLTPDGVKRVEAFAGQDQILTRTELDPNAPLTIGWVDKLFVGWSQIFELEVHGRLICTTDMHPFHVRNRGWIPAVELQVGDLLATDNPDLWLPVERAELTNRFDTVYNLRVANDHTYFISDHDWGFALWAHNSCITPKTGALSGQTFSQGKMTLTTASKAYKGSTRLGHALCKHAGRNPNIWGKISGSPSTYHSQATKHLREIYRAPGDFKRVTNPNGVTFLEKMLPDGRGVRLQLDHVFKGFID